MDFIMADLQKLRNAGKYNYNQMVGIFNFCIKFWSYIKVVYINYLQKQPVNIVFSQNCRIHHSGVSASLHKGHHYLPCLLLLDLWSEEAGPVGGNILTEVTLPVEVPLEIDRQIDRQIGKGSKIKVSLHHCINPSEYKQ